MNFQSLGVTATYYLDEKKEAGIIFHGPDTPEWLRFHIAIGRSAAIIEAASKDFTDNDDKGIAILIARKERYCDALCTAFAGSTNVTLNGDPVTNENCRMLFWQFSADERNKMIEWLLSRESFAGK